MASRRDATSLGSLREGAVGVHPAIRDMIGDDAFFGALGAYV